MASLSTITQSRNNLERMNTTSIPIPVDLQDLLFKLEFLSKIQPGHKINTNIMGFVNADSWYGSLSRYLNHENREITINFINNIINLTIDSINKYCDSIFLAQIINRLNSARIGISKLDTTYRDDPKFSSKLAVCLTNIDMQLEKYKNLVRGCEELIS